MKKLLVLLFSLLISVNSYGETGCSEKEENDDFSCGLFVSCNVYGKDFIDSTVFFQKRYDLFFLPNESEPYSGENLCVYKNESGQIYLKGSIKNGKKDGKQTIFLKNGAKFEQVSFKDGELDGKFVVWYPTSGKKYAIGEVKYPRMKVGKWTAWHENGQKKAEGKFTDGKRVGNWYEWDDEGKIIAQAIYKDGVCDSGNCQLNWVSN